MTEREAILIIENFYFQLKYSLKYREDKGNDVMESEYMIPDALGNVLNVAKRKSVNKIIDDLKKDK